MDKEKNSDELNTANKEIAFLNQEKENRATELKVAYKEIAYQIEESGKRAAELAIANIELVFQNKEKEKRAAELIVANTELAFQNEEKEKRGTELIIANKELAFQNKEKEKRAAELIIANKKLIFENKEKEKRANELIIANKELVFQNKEKENRAAELVVAHRENEKIGVELIMSVENEKRTAQLLIADKALVASEERYRRLFEAAQDGILILNADTGRIEDVNPYMMEMLGYAHSEFLGKELWEIGLFSDINANKEAFLKLKEDGYIRYSDLPLKTKNGLAISVEFVSNRYDVSGGQVIQCNIRNITERKIAEENNKQLTERLLLATQSAKLGIWDWDIKNNMLKWDEGMYLLYDIDELEFESIYDGWLLRIHPEDIERVNDTMQQALVGKEDYNPIFRLVWKDSSVHYIEASGLIERDNDGNAIRMIGANWDITERRKSEIALQQSEARLKGIIDSQTSYLLRTDLQGNYTYCNPKFKDDFGWLHSNDNSTLIGMNGMVSIMPYHHQAVQDLVEKCFANPNQVFHIEIDKPTKNYGVKTTIWDFMLLTDLDGRPDEIQCAGIDITDRKKAEIELKQVNEHLQKQTKDLEVSNAELEQFAYVASHDLQEPLRMITSFLGKLEQKYEGILDEKGKQYIFFAVDGAVRMRKIILDLLEFSRVGRNDEELVNIDLNLLVDGVCKLLSNQIEEKKAVFEIKKLPTLTFYKSPLVQIFQNLISNTLKYTKANVSPQITIACKENESDWEISVADNGIGISEEYYDKIFILFQRLHNKKEYSGTGIGLAITKKIIEKHGGKIWVESEVGKGSTFYLTIKKQIA